MEIENQKPPRKPEKASGLGMIKASFPRFAALALIIASTSCEQTLEKQGPSSPPKSPAGEQSLKGLKRPKFIDQIQIPESLEGLEELSLFGVSLGDTAEAVETTTRPEEFSDLRNDIVIPCVEESTGSPLATFVHKITYDWREKNPGYYSLEVKLVDEDIDPIEKANIRQTKGFSSGNVRSISVGIPLLEGTDEFIELRQKMTEAFGPPKTSGGIIWWESKEAKIFMGIRPGPRDLPFGQISFFSKKRVPECAPTFREKPVIPQTL